MLFGILVAFQLVFVLFVLDVIVVFDLLYGCVMSSSADLLAFLIHLYLLNSIMQLALFFSLLSSIYPYFFDGILRQPL